MALLDPDPKLKKGEINQGYVHTAKDFFFVDEDGHGQVRERKNNTSEVVLVDANSSSVYPDDTLPLHHFKHSGSNDSKFPLEVSKL